MRPPALLESLRSGYHRQDLLADLGAGVLVGVVAIPLSLGLAIASGVSPAQGLVTAVIGGFLISILGGSRFQIGGPAGAFVGLCATGVAQYGYAGLALATVMAGMLLLFLGFARLGRAISFIPVPVVIGFTTGIAVIIATTQLAPALGLPEPAKPLSHAHERLAYLWRIHAGWSPTALTTCLATLGVILGFRCWWPRLPGALIALILVGGGVWALGWQVPTVGSQFPDLPSTFPAPHLPGLGLAPEWTLTELVERLRALSGLALAIALLGAIESLLSAVVADGLGGDRHDPDTELIAQGAANLISPWFGGLPVTGVIARTSTNIRAGARSPVAGIVHAVTVAAAILLCGPLLAHLPLACLAGVLFAVCWSMAELRHWPHILRAGRSDAFLLPLACCLTIFLDLTWAVVIGVLLAMFFFVRRMAETTRIDRDAPPSEVGLAAAVPAGVDVYAVRGPFFFGAATLLRDLDAQAGRRALVLRLREVPFIDTTAAFGLRELIASHRARGARVVVCELGAEATHDLTRHGLDTLLGPGGVQPTLAIALAELAPAA